MDLSEQQRLERVGATGLPSEYDAHRSICRCLRQHGGWGSEHSVAARIAHEAGHAVGYNDDGPGQMNNTVTNENPVEEAMGYPKRTTYEQHECTCPASDVPLERSGRLHVFDLGICLSLAGCGMRKKSLSRLL